MDVVVHQLDALATKRVNCGCAHGSILPADIIPPQIVSHEHNQRSWTITAAAADAAHLGVRRSSDSGIAASKKEKGSGAPQEEQDGGALYRYHRPAAAYRGQHCTQGASGSRM